MPAWVDRSRLEGMERLRGQLTRGAFEDARARAATMTREQVIEWAFATLLGATSASA